jgi:transposase
MTDLQDAARSSSSIVEAIIASVFRDISCLWKEGNRLGRHLFHDIKLRGYTGSLSNLERLLGTWRRAEKPTNDEKLVAKVEIAGPVRDPDTGHAISPVIAAALCMKPRGQLSIRQAKKVGALKCGSHAFVTMRNLAVRFKGILRTRNVKALDAWIDDAIETDLVPILRFARILRRDIDAVYNAIELPWSNGQVEGQVNRLKTIKRAMYGRAGHELLRARMPPLSHTE